MATDKIGNNIEKKMLIEIIDLGNNQIGIGSCFTRRIDVLNILLQAVKTLALAEERPELPKVFMPSIVDMRKVGL